MTQLIQCHHLSLPKEVEKVTKLWLQWAHPLFKRACDPSPQGFIGSLISRKDLLGSSHPTELAIRPNSHNGRVSPYPAIVHNGGDFSKFLDSPESYEPPSPLPPGGMIPTATQQPGWPGSKAPAPPGAHTCQGRTSLSSPPGPHFPWGGE